MSINQDLNPQLRASKKFYEKIRLYSEDLKLDDAKTDEKPSDQSDESRFGCISKEDFESILQSYKRQQDDTSLKEKPVKCDNVVGGSFAKLLFSKEAFHNPASTQFLIDDLRIADVNRNSFLGGLSTYEADETQKLSGIKKEQNRLYIEMTSLEISQLIESKQVDSAKEKIEEISKIDRDDPNVFAAKGHYHLHCRQYKDAVDFLHGAFLKGCDRITKLLSKSLTELANVHYHRGDYRSAQQYYIDALHYDSSDKYAKLQLDICKEKLLKTPYGYRNSFAKHRG